jgi:hypothetical protein
VNAVACAYCGDYVPDTRGERVGAVRFCGRTHVIEWYSLPQHDRRQSRSFVFVDRRSS